MLPRKTNCIHCSRNAGFFGKLNKVIFPSQPKTHFFRDFLPERVDGRALALALVDACTGALFREKCPYKEFHRRLRHDLLTLLISQLLLVICHYTNLCPRYSQKRARTHTHMHASTHTRAVTHTHTRTVTRTHTLACARAHTHTRTHTHKLKETFFDSNAIFVYQRVTILFLETPQLCTVWMNLSYQTHLIQHFRSLVERSVMLSE